MTLTHKLLTRDEFRNSVFTRDSHKCVVCGNPAKDAHHILERRLWTDGGYYLENGASVCEDCHLNCERTIISVEQIREFYGITKPIIPEHLYRDQIYDKWGNPILENGQRLKGELFFDESVQKILAEGKVLDLFTTKVKYPRTYHLPWSEGITDDDRVLKNLDNFKDKRVIVTRKMDGENSTLYSNYFHARSVDGRSHPSRDWVKNFWSTICGDIPEGWRICGENLYAKHSIHYENLESYLQGFSIWNDKNVCLGWDDTIEWFNLFGITAVPLLYDGVFDENLIKKLYDNKRDYDIHEGYVVRLAQEFSYGDFRKSVGKFVRHSHVAPNAHHWFGQKITPNKLG